jgi:hypothetical protein
MAMNSTLGRSGGDAADATALMQSNAKVPIVHKSVLCILLLVENSLLPVEFA